MFLPGRTVLTAGSADFPTARDGMRSPLARKLFGIDGALLRKQRSSARLPQTLTLTHRAASTGVASVFFGADFVTVRKADAADWALLKPEVFAAIMDFYASGEARTLTRARSCACLFFLLALALALTRAARAAGGAGGRCAGARRHRGARGRLRAGRDD
jgi:hypothetical protein